MKEFVLAAWFAAGPAGPRDGNVSALAAGGGVLWAAHFDRGLSSYQDGRWRHWGRGDGLPSEWVDDLAWDGERLWGATERGVFWVRDGSVETPREEELRQATAAVWSADGLVWVAQRGRVLVYQGRSRQAVLPLPEKHPQRVWAQGGVVWVAGLEGLWRLEGGLARRFGAIDGSLASNWATAVRGGPGGVWVGTYDGGVTRFTTRGPERVLPGAWVNLGALSVQDGRVAVGEMEGGLHLFEGGRWRRFGKADGLPEADVSAVLFDGGSLWVGTRNGLGRLE